jgi:hypothetical protein
MSESNVLDNETEKLISGTECQRTKKTLFEMVKNFISITNALILYFRNSVSN